MIYFKIIIFLTTYNLRIKLFIKKTNIFIYYIEVIIIFDELFCEIFNIIVNIFFK